MQSNNIIGIAWLAITIAVANCLEIEQECSYILYVPWLMITATH